MVKTRRTLKKAAPFHTGKERCRGVAVGDTIISEQGSVAIIGRDQRYHVCGAAHTFEEANNLVRQHHPDVLLIEPFLENRDAIRWIKDLASEFPRIRILVVSRQSERTYAERALCAGASGYWMKNSSVDELMHAIETVLAGDILRQSSNHFRCHAQVRRWSQPSSRPRCPQRSRDGGVLTHRGWARHRSDCERTWHQSQDGRDTFRAYQAQTRLS